MRAGWVALLMIAPFLAGCAGEAETGVVEPVAEEAPREQRPVVAAGTISMTATFDSGSISTSTNSNANGVFSVGMNATAILLEAHWSCTNECMLRGYLRGPDTRAELPAESPLRWLFELPEPGDWSWSFGAEGAVVQAEGEVRITVFFDAIPEGYTAFL